MHKPPEFLAKLRACGEGVEIFANALILKPEAISVAGQSRIDDFCRLEGGEALEIGRNVHVSSFCSIFGGGTCRIGDYVGLAQGSRVITGSEQLDAVMSAVAPEEWREVNRTEIVLDHLSFLGTNSVVLPGTGLGMGAVVAAGSVVTKPVPAWEVWAGVPAKPITTRDPDALRARGVPVDELTARSLFEPATPGGQG